MDGSTTESEKMPVLQLSSMLKLKVIPEIRGSKAILRYISLTSVLMEDLVVGFCLPVCHPVAA